MADPTSVGEVKQAVEALRGVDDPEVFHIAEDELHRAVLAAIADRTQISGGRWAAEMAAAALETTGITTERWYA